MEEFVLNLHIHSVYSDGTWVHQKIAEAGILANLDGLIITDHNILVNHLEGYFFKKKKKILLIIGQEIHDKNLNPPKNHLLAFGQSQDLSIFAEKPQQLINQVKKNGGISIIAHPYERELPQVHEPDISWVDWSVEGFDGIEIWNHLSELKNVSRNWFQLLCHIFFPSTYATSAHPMAIQKWDQLLLSGKKIFAAGGSDAHNLRIKKAFLVKWVFPYLFHFQSVNNHLLLREPLSGEFLMDKMKVLNAIREGNFFIGYDYIVSSRGFRFYAQGRNETAIMGEEVELDGSVTLHITLPEEAECKLIHNGTVIKQWNNQKICMYITKSTGYYRVECTISFLGITRGWIYSNPIYVVASKTY